MAQVTVAQVTRVGWLVDDLGAIGGAEFTQAEFRAAAPKGVEVVDCPAGGVVTGLDKYVCHNIVSYCLAELPLTGWKYHHDVGPHLRPEVWKALRMQSFRHICCSPLQAKHMKLDAECIPPPVNLDAFREAAESAGERKGAVAVGTWMNPNKNPQGAAEWAAGNGGIDFFGGGPFAPPGSQEVAYDDLPEILARYKTFVHLPRVIEPCGRTVIEAWAAGVPQIVVNKLVGATHWIEQEPDKLETAALDFWNLVLA